ncbi:MAG TPA: asparagine synthase (glutamine-hydrolyzing) [Candidatus Limnocylindrales bacterium]|nr:asparagine synthase (glutamine-hydrolyzing) [Candidatus Limnocylindrales bacterium]
MDATLCGIAGFTHRNQRPDPGRIREAMSSILHRGPDQQGVFESAKVSLAATRLKIIDLASGDQPILSEDGDVVIVFNGEIYNYEELRRELEQRGRRFRTHTDTEAVLVAFLEWDVECFSRLRGMFAVALWSESRERLVLARDRMGIKPLYFTRQGSDLYFGSELKAIFVHPEVPRSLSPAALDCYLALNYVPGPYTMVEGIEKLPPGCWLAWSNGNTRQRRYWQFPAAAPQQWTLEAAKWELDRLLRQSVREHLIADVPLGIWLSGGLDSSTILEYASAASTRQLSTFSISYAGRSCDESEQIRSTAARYQTDHHEFDLNAECDLAGAVEQFAHHFDEPNADGGALPVWFLSRMTRRSVTVALSGEGADELFAGYLTYRADELARRARRMPRWMLRAACATARRLPVSDESLGLDYKLKRFAEGCLMPAARAHVYWNGTFSGDEKRALAAIPLPEALNALLQGATEDSLETFLRFDQRCYLPDDILAKLDRMSMASSIEVRPPFLDHRIVEFAASLPACWKLRGTTGKVVLRELMRGKLPESTLKRKKMGFDFPAHEWLRGPLRALLTDTLLGDSKPELFHRAMLENYVRQHLERRANMGYHLWGLMLLFMWIRRWKIQTTPVFEAERQPSARILTSI